VLPDERGQARVRADLPVVGLPLLRRTALAAGRAGFARVLVAGIDTREAAVLAGTGAAVLPDREPPASEAAGRVVLLSERVIPQVDWLRRLRTMPLSPGHVYLDGAVAGAVDAREPARLVGEAARRGAIEAALAALRADHKVAAGPECPGGRFVLEGTEDIDRAERWMLRSLVKDSEGFMSRHFERRLSLFATRRLARTAVTPNAMTLASVAIGVAAAPFFLSPRPAWQVAGALLFLLHSIVDGCDGELARLKFLQSRLGAALDFWGDNLVHVAVFGGMAVGWSHAAGSPWPLAAGAIAMLGTLAAAVWLHRWQAGPGEGARPPDTAGRLVDLFAHRDFIYLILALAFWGRAWWFLGLAACGIPLFLVALGWAGGRRRTAGAR
jgi:phosphatidylglycerophosphate synthase